MAVMGASPAGRAATGMKIALIAFVVLTVASLTGTIILYTYQSDLESRVTSATGQSERSEQKARESVRQLQEFARLVVGEATDEVPKIKEAVTKALKAVVEDANLQAANIAPDSALLTVLKALHAQFSDKVHTLAQAAEERDQLRLEREQLEKAAKQSRQEFDEQVKKLQSDYESLEQAGVKNHEAWNEQVTKLTAQLEAASESASQQLSNERQQRQAVEKQLADANKRVQELVETLAAFRPRADLTSALQIADGFVVRAMAGEDLVYISLGAKDSVKRGMTFAVYSRTRGIPEDGKGKAAIEVTEVFDSTSECRVTSRTEGDPVLEGDVVANPVFDRSRKYNFLVAGDFDLDFDGRIDDPGGEQVGRLIVQSGGLLVKKLDTRTDFVVLGAAPPLSMPAGEGDSPEARERAAQREAARKAFDAIVQETKALSIPVLTRTQFMHFLGVGVPKNVPDDPPAWSGQRVSS